MSKAILENKHFHDEGAAYEYLERRVWPDGPVCPHCGGVTKIGKLQGKSTRIGVYKCYQCRKPFRATVGTVFESSHVPLRLWLQAVHLMAASKKGISSNQLHRILGVTLKTAWFMSHRIREAMAVLHLEPMGGAGEIVEVDETFIGLVEGQRKTRGSGHKNVVLSLVQRGGKSRSFHVPGTRRYDLEKIVKDNIHPDTFVMTDEARHYQQLGKHFAGHDVVNHSKDEYVRGNVSTNTVEGFYSVFKRGMKGVYQHCAEKHLHRYVAEFDFRYSNRVALGINDIGRADHALMGIVGKRLMYVTTD
jgi:transposase-like protein